MNTTTARRWITGWRTITAAIAGIGIITAAIAVGHTRTVPRSTGIHLAAHNANGANANGANANNGVRNNGANRGDGVVAKPNGPAPPLPCRNQVRDLHRTFTHETWPGTADWSVSGRGPASLSMNRSVSVSNTFTTTVTVSSKVISAAVGFNVTWTSSVGTAYTVTVPEGQEWIIHAGYLSIVHQFDIYRTCANGNSTKVGSGYAYEYNHLLYDTARLH